MLSLFKQGTYTYFFLTSPIIDPYIVKVAHKQVSRRASNKYYIFLCKGPKDKCVCVKIDFKIC